MKKIISLILALALIMAVSACGEMEITMQEISDANQTEVLLKNHKSVYIQNEMDEEVWNEVYLTKDYTYNYAPDEESDWVEFMTDDARYCYVDGDRLLYLFITPDGVGDFVNARAERSAGSALIADAAEETIESVSEKDGLITMKSVLSQKAIEDMAEFGATFAKFEYVLDAKTREITSLTSDYTYDDGEAFHVVTEVTYDAEMPETLKEFLEYVNQTENLRNVTIVSNPGTEKEESKSIQAPKGLIIGLEFDDAVAESIEFYTDAACTESYDPYADTASDLTIYVKWTE